MLCSLAFSSLLAQEAELLRPGEYYGTTNRNGQVIKILIIDGDTLPVIDLDMVLYTNQRDFSDRKDRRRYHKWRRHAAKVYPLAAEAIKIYREIEKETVGMSSRKRKKYIKSKEKELSPEYEEQLKRLTKTQGYILMKMVERELEQPFYDVISDLRGGWQAIKWQGMGRLYGYNLRSGYDAEKDPILEYILQDLNISYED